MKINPPFIGPIKDYLNYYWLEEEYLEKEVYSDFHTKRGHLTPEQFFSILFWKSKRPIKKSIRPSLPNEAIQDLAQNIYRASDDKKLDVLLKLPGFGIAMASAVLTILYPEKFTVYDYRLREQLNSDCFKQYRDNGKLLRNIYGGHTEPEIERVKLRYAEFFEIVKRIASDNKLSLRDCDRALWAKSWYEDLQDFVGSVDKPGRKNLEKDLQVNYDTQV